MKGIYGETTKYNNIQHIICRLWSQPGHVPPIIEKRPCIYHFLPPSAPQYFGLPTQYFWQVYASGIQF